MDTISPMPDDLRGSGPGRRHQLSERRREQNRLAQKNYRAKKKRYLQRLEDIAKEPGTAGAQSSTPNGGFTGFGGQIDENASGESIFNDLSVQGTLLDSSPHTYTPVNYQAGNHVNIPASLMGCFQLQRETGESTDQDYNSVGLLDGSSMFPSAINSALATYSDDLLPQRLNSAGQDSVGIGPESTLPDRSDDIHQTPRHHTLQHSLNSSRLVDAQLPEGIVNQKFTLQDILTAGLRALPRGERQLLNSTLAEEPENEARRILPSRTDSERCFLPDVRTNTIRLSTMSFVAACFTNAAMLGLSPAELMNKRSQSPFYQPQMSDELARTACAGQFVHLSPQLRPSTTQLIHPHHPYLDILPFPAFRDRTIQLLQIDHLAFDAEELCRDLQSDGLICWGSTISDGRELVGSGVPWDVRSWEIRPWFLKKWWMLMDGVNGEMYQQTRWWCEVRGEKSSYPW